MQEVVKHEVLGEVLVKFRANAKNFIARRKDTGIVLTAPLGVSWDKIHEVLDGMAPRLLAVQPRAEVNFYDGQQLHFDGLDITISTQSLHPDRILYKQISEGAAVIRLGVDTRFEEEKARLGISNVMKILARKNASRVLLPRGRELAALHGCHPSGWKITKGSRILGQCDGHGIISLSYMNLFLPVELRDYIICHELAHLSEMNHSERFHDVCDAYLGGREKEMIAKLKKFKWPLIRK